MRNVTPSELYQFTSLIISIVTLMIVLAEFILKVK